MRALARQERRERRSTAFEVSRPATGNCRGAVGTAAIGRQAVVLDQIAVALDHSFAALRTARVFPLLDHAGKISSVNVAKAGSAADFWRRAAESSEVVSRATSFCIL